jgi:hypothetical protein
MAGESFEGDPQQPPQQARCRQAGLHGLAHGLASVLAVAADDAHHRAAASEARVATTGSSGLNNIEDSMAGRKCRGSRARGELVRQRQHRRQVLERADGAAAGLVVAQACVESEC